jgi:hydrogenase expression/formation protein HypC
MCLSVPGQLVAVDGASTPRMGTADFGGIRKAICLDAVPDARVGDFVLVHVGYALTVLDENEARSVLQLLGELVSEEGP